MSPRPSPIHVEISADATDLVREIGHVRAHLSEHQLEEIRALHANIRDDIELGLCSVQCAAALHPEGACRCACRGDNHGKLWADA